MRSTASRAVLVVVLALCLFACQGLKKDTFLTGDVDYQSFVVIAHVDPAKSQHVTSLLQAHAIHNLVEGSAVYWVSVHPSDKDRAIAVLKADSRRNNYYITF